MSPNTRGGKVRGSGRRGNGTLEEEEDEDEDEDEDTKENGGGAAKRVQNSLVQLERARASV